MGGLRRMPLTEVLAILFFTGILAGCTPQFAREAGTGGGAGGGGGSAPVASDGTLSVAEDGTGTGALSATDADGDALSYSIVANGSKGTATVTNAATGAYSYVPSANANGTDTFTFKANDGTLDSGTQTITVTINAANDDPTLSSFSNQYGEINTSITGIAFTVDEGGGTDEDAQTLTFTKTSSNTTLIPTANITINYTDNGASSASALSPTIDIAPAAGQTGLSTITVRATDSSGAYAERTFVVGITNVKNLGGAGNCKVWLRGDSGVNGGSASAGSLVTSWTNQCTGGVTATSASLANGDRRPIYRSSVAALNNMPTLEFDRDGDGHDALNIDYTALAGSKTIQTVALVGRYFNPTSPGQSDCFDFTARQFWVGGGTAGNAGDWETSAMYCYHSAPRGYFNWLGADTGYSSTSKTFDTDPHVSVLQIDTNTYKIWIDGVQVLSDSNTQQLGTYGPLSVGGWYGNAFNPPEYGFEGQISEVVFFTSPLGGTDREALENYLGSKYGVSITH